MSTKTNTRFYPSATVHIIAHARAHSGPHSVLHPGPRYTGRRGWVEGRGMGAGGDEPAPPGALSGGCFWRVSYEHRNYNYCFRECSLPQPSFDDTIWNLPTSTTTPVLSRAPLAPPTCLSLPRLPPPLPPSAPWSFPTSSLLPAPPIAFRNRRLSATRARWPG